MGWLMLQSRLLVVKCRGEELSAVVPLSRLVCSLLCFALVRRQLLVLFTAITVYYHSNSLLRRSFLLQHIVRQVRVRVRLWSLSGYLGLSVCLSVCLSGWLALRLSVCSSAYLCVCLSPSLSLSLSVSLSPSLSLYLSLSLSLC